MSRPARWCLRPTTSVGEVGALAGAPSEPRVMHWPWVALGGLALLVVASAVLATRPGASAPASPAQPRLEVRPAADLPVADLGWVRMRDHWTTTIGRHAGQGASLGELLVAADTTLMPGASFPVHRHAGIEVVTVVLDGSLALSEGGRTTELPAGTVHAIAAGAGIMHSESNRGVQPVRYLQLWLASRAPDRAPAAEQQRSAATGELLPLPLTLLSPDVQVRRATLAPGAEASWSVAHGRVAYVVNIGGDVDVDTVRLADGDGATLTAGRFVATGAGAAPAQLVVVDLPAP